MPSHLRLQTSFEEPIAVHATYHNTANRRPIKKARMSLTQTYYLASSARSKLSKEAARADHDLRRLVLSANHLDNLMLELQQAEQESEAWLNQSIREASRPEEPRHVQWMDSIAEDYEQDEDDSDDSSDDDSEVDESEMFAPMPRKLKTLPVVLSSEEADEHDDAEYDEESEEEELALTRVSSKHSPPELLEDESESDSEAEDDMPSSPEDSTLELTDKQRQAIATTAFYDLKSQQGLADYVQQQQQAQQPLIAPCC